MNTPLLSILIFSPLAAAVVALLLRGDNAQRWWALISTTIIAALSIPLWTKFDTTTAAFQFVEFHAWIPWLKINYAVGIDGLRRTLLCGTWPQWDLLAIQMVLGCVLLGASLLYMRKIEQRMADVL